MRTSRKTLALIRATGVEPTVIEYLKTPPSREELRALVPRLGVSQRALLREKGRPYAELGLADPNWTDDELLDFIGRHPVLLNRPIVITDRGAALYCPSERVLDLLPALPPGPFVKEYGELVIDARGQRLL